MITLKPTSKSTFLVTIVSAVLLGLSYPNIENLPTGLLAWFAFVPFLWANKQLVSFKNYILQASLLAILAILIDVYWLNYYSFAAYLFCVFSQFYFLVLPLAIHYFIQKKLGFKKALLILPIVWTFTDWLAHIAPHGMQVYLLPYTQANNTWLIQFIDMTGMWGITFWVIMMNVLVILVLERKTKKRIIFASLWLIMPILYSNFIYLNKRGVLGSEQRTSKVSIIQTNLDSYLADSSITQKTFDQIISLSDSAVRTAQPDLLVLPEAAIQLPLFQDKNFFEFTKKAISTWQTSVAIGYAEYPDTRDKARFKNNALVFTPQLAMFWDSLKIKAEDVKVYQKRYGLPFVELMPYFEKIPTTRGSAMERGTEPFTFEYASFTGNKFKVALSICWEQMYPHRVAELVNQNADFIALMNNDAWFGTSGGGKQLLSFTRLRAIENRRSVVRCSNGGISCFIDPFGKISGRLPWYEATIGTADVLCVNKKSFFTKNPAWLPKLCGGVLLLLLAFLFLLAKRKFTP
jgi:apolipoprotein N-acyltransferase